MSPAIATNMSAMRANRSLFASSHVTQAIPRKTGARDRLAVAISTNDA
jgi:hypothetical protein